MMGEVRVCRRRKRREKSQDAVELDRFESGQAHLKDDFGLAVRVGSCVICGVGLRRDGKKKSVRG